MSVLTNIKVALEDGLCRNGIEPEGWDGFEACIEDSDVDGSPRCPLLRHECADCHGCYADEFDTEPEPDAGCTGGGEWSCTLPGTIAALVAVVEAAQRVEARYRDVLIGVSAEELRAALAELTADGCEDDDPRIEPPETDAVIRDIESERETG